MKGLGKVHPPDAGVLEDIWLSFLPGAKIGVLGAERRGQELAPQDHGGRGHGVHRRSVRGRRHHRRISPAGAAARRDEDRARQRRRRRRRDQSAARSLRRGQREAGRGPVARGDGEGPRRAVAHPGQDRRRQRVGPRLAARAGDGRAAPAAGRRRRHHALRRRTPPRRAVPAAAAVARPAAARRADQPPRRRIGRLARALPQGLSRAPSSRSRTIATSSTTSPAGFSSSIAARASRGKATTRRGSSRSRGRLALEEKTETKRQRTLARELEWVRMSPRAGRPRARRA